MKKLFSLKKNEYIIFAIALLISSLFIFFTLKKIKSESIKRIEGSLLTINKSSQETIKQWTRYQRKNTQQLAGNKFIIEQALGLLQLKQDSASLVSSPQTSELRHFLQPILNASEDLGVFVIAPNYTSVFSMRNSNTGSLNIMAINSKELLDKVLIEGKTVLIPIFESEIPVERKYVKFKRHTMFSVTPILHQNKIIAAFSVRLDTYTDFSRILELGKMGKTSETFAYDNQNHKITSNIDNPFEIKRKSNTSSKATTKTKNLSASNAGLFTRDNSNTLLETIDERGKAIFAISSWDKDLALGIVTKIDKDEALNEYFFLSKILIIAFLGIFVIGVFVISYIISQRKQVENSLTRHNERLEHLVEERTKALKQNIKTKDKFFSILAHDLRGPFMGLLSLFEIMLDNPKALTEDKKNVMMRKIYDSGTNLYKLLENLLSWSRSQTNEIQLTPERISINELIEENININIESAKNKNIEILSEIEDAKYVLADKNTVDTVLRNLISNGIKFTEKSGQLRIKAFSTRKMVKIIVEDNGVGIPKEKVSKLFKPGEKISSKGTNEETGTGLGLLLCKEFIELNNGNIYVESNVGVGSVFTVELPIAV